MGAIISGRLHLVAFYVFFMKGADELLGVAESEIVLAVQFGEMVLHAILSEGN